MRERNKQTNKSTVENYTPECAIWQILQEDPNPNPNPIPAGHKWKSPSRSKRDQQREYKPWNTENETAYIQTKASTNVIGDMVFNEDSKL